MSLPLKILFVDDHIGVRDAIITSLTQNKNDFDFSVATNKEESLEVINSIPEISTVIMDLNLNGTNGLDVANELRKIKPGLNILVYSMYNDPIHIEQALANNVQGFISKDATIDELRQAVISVAAGNMYFNTQSKNIMKIMLSKKSDIDDSLSKASDQIYILYSALTQKEKDVFYYLAQKMDPHEIAKILGKSQKTVVNQKSIIYSKMNIRDRLDLLEKARALGLIL